MNTKHDIECLTLNCRISSSEYPSLWMIFICLTSVDFPLSPVPRMRILKTFPSSALTGETCFAASCAFSFFQEMPPRECNLARRSSSGIKQLPILSSMQSGEKSKLIIIGWMGQYVNGWWVEGQWSGKIMGCQRITRLVAMQLSPLKW